MVIFHSYVSLPEGNGKKKGGTGTRLGAPTRRVHGKSDRDMSSAL